MNKIVLIAAAVGAFAVGSGGAAFYFASMAQNSLQTQVTVNLQSRDSDSAKIMDENAPLIQGEKRMLIQYLDFEIVRTAGGKPAFIVQVDTSIRPLFENPEDTFELEKVVLTGFLV